MAISMEKQNLFLEELLRYVVYKMSAILLKSAFLFKSALVYI